MINPFKSNTHWRARISAVETESPPRLFPKPPRDLIWEALPFSATVHGPRSKGRGCNPKSMGYTDGNRSIAAASICASQLRKCVTSAFLHRCHFLKYLGRCLNKRRDFACHLDTRSGKEHLKTHLHRFARSLEQLINCCSCKESQIHVCHINPTAFKQNLSGSLQF